MNLKDFQKNESLSKHTTFCIGGTAKFFYEVKNNNDIIQAIELANKERIPFFILGGGSNILFSDNGFNGLVIKISEGEIDFNNNVTKADAGVLLMRLILESVKKGFSGLEFLAGIPGTLGGAIFGNAGLGKDGHCIGDVIKTVKLLMSDGKIKKVNKKWMEFSYRHSRLKDFKIKETPIILSAVLEFKKKNKEELKEIVIEKSKIRVEKYPIRPSAGCIFKNFSNQSTAKLIDECGLKGRKIGGAQVSKKHANFIINTGNATSKNVLDLINLIKKEIQEKFGVKLEEEVKIM